MSGLLAVLRAILTLFAKGVKSSPIAVSEKKAGKVVPETQIRTEPLFKNDSERLKVELGELKYKNFQLYHLLYDVCDYCKHKFSKSVVITMIYRTQEEQDSIYKDDPKYKVKKFKSPHQIWSAVDIRSSTFETSEIEILVNYINNTYNKLNYYGWTAKNHQVGNGALHFHLQFSKKEQK